MNLATFLILAVLAAAVGLAVRSLRRRRQAGGGCSGCCASCKGGHCH